MVNVYEYDTYIAPINHLIDRYIREYDISKANINILLYLGLIDKSTYNYLYNTDRMTRQIKVGYMQKNRDIAKALSEGFKFMRTEFCTMNNIQNYDILSVKKDAIYLIDKIPSHTTISNQNNTIEFVTKNTYTSWYRLDKVEYYYYLNTMTKEEKLDIKGISDITIGLHENYMIDLLKYLFNLAQNKRYIDAIDTIRNFISKLNDREVSIEYYRELNNRSMFKVNGVVDGYAMYLEGLNSKVKPTDIDISYNIGILTELYKIYMGYAIGGKYV